jgi:hypothetical protein
VLSCADSWYCVKQGGNVGYVLGEYLIVDAAEKSGETGEVEMMDWFKRGKEFFKRGTIATITDVKTGIQWQVKRWGGTNHADVEPLTAEDTENMKKAAGGKWSWDRRPVLVTIDGVTSAASANFEPHGKYSIKNNKFKGHSCIHFLNSRTHGSNKKDSEHQAAVKEAYNN